MAPGDHFTAQQDNPSPTAPPAHGYVMRREATFLADVTSISVSVSSEHLVSPDIRTTNDDYADVEKGIEM
jgi:hypothetical protein